MEGVVQDSQPALPSHHCPSIFPRGVGFSFLFAVPIILLVFATFLVGGNVQTLVCRSWESGELYEVGLRHSGAQREVRGDAGRAGGLEGCGSQREQKGGRDRRNDGNS